MVETRGAIKEALREARRLQETIGRGPGGRAIALTITKLEEALMWCDQADTVYRNGMEA